MGIFTPEEIANRGIPDNIPDALAKGAINFLCRGAPILSGYGILTGNLPAIAFGAGGSIACGIPLFPIDDAPPPGIIPMSGGQCDFGYRINFRLLNHNLDCSVANDITDFNFARGPIRFFEEFVRNEQYSCRPTPVPLLRGGYFTGDGSRIVIGNYSPAIGGFCSISPVPQIPQGDNCGNQAAQPPVLPPGTQTPPGYPDAPILPGLKGTVPYRDPTDAPGRPPRQLPWKVPDIPLPVIVPVQPTLNVPISVPINIPVSIDVPISFGFSPSITVQLDSDGNIRTPPDLLCPCEVEPQSSGGGAVSLVTFSVPYYECGANEAPRVVNLQVDPASIPSTLEKDLLSSAILAREGCKARTPEQKPEVRLSSGTVDGVLGRIIQVPLVDPDIVCVRLKVMPERPDDFRQTKIFAGAGQRLFGVIDWHLEGSSGGGSPADVWDMITDFSLPKTGKPRQIKLLLKPGLRWELWDTGLRV